MGLWRRVALADAYLVGLTALVALFPHPIWLAVWVGSGVLYPVGGGLANLQYRYWSDASVVGLATFVTILGALIARLGPIQALLGTISVGIGLAALHYYAVRWTPDPLPILSAGERERRRQKAFGAGGGVGLAILVTWGFFAALLTVDFAVRGRWQASPLGIPLLPVLLLGVGLLLAAYLSDRRAKSARRRP